MVWTHWWFQSLWKMWTSVEMIIPYIMESHKIVPNHQSVYLYIYIYQISTGQVSECPPQRCSPPTTWDTLPGVFFWTSRCGPAHGLGSQHPQLPAILERTWRSFNMKFIVKLATNGDFSGKTSEIQVYGIILISCEMPELKGHLNEELSIASGPKNKQCSNCVSSIQAVA